MDRLQVKNPLYPLVCLLSAVVLLAVGLAGAGHGHFSIYILAVCTLQAIFGLGRATLKCLLIFIPLGVLCGGFSWLFVGEVPVAVQMAGRVVLVGVAAVPMVTLPPVNLSRCLNGMGCPRVLTLGMLMAIGFVPIIAGEVGRVREAMRTRGVRVAFYRAFVIPVMLRVLGMSDTMALSLETRAFSTGNDPASVYRPVVFTVRDGLYCALAAMLALSWAVML